MAFYGGQPQQGLDWYRLLSIYHTLGKESSSHKEIIDIGKELKTLNGNHNAAIQGINAQLSILIARNTNTLSAGDLASLKQAIVDGMKQHADENPEQCAARVETDGESVLFTDDVKEVLTGLVRQKARVLEEVDFSKMIADIGTIDAKLRTDGKMDRDIESIKTRLGSGVPLLDADYNAIIKWKTEFEKDSAKLISGFDAAEARNNPSTQAFATRRDALADAIVAKMGNTGDASTRADAALGANEALYRLPVSTVRDLFVVKSELLYLRSTNIFVEAQLYSKEVLAQNDDNPLAFSIDTSVTVDEIVDAIDDRYPTTGFLLSRKSGKPAWLDEVELRNFIKEAKKWKATVPKFLSTDIYRLAHSYLTKLQLDS